MPGMNGTGPQGQGPRTGRGQGRCKARQTPDDASNAMNNMPEQYGQRGRGMNSNQNGGGRMRGNQNGGKGICRRRNNA